MNYNLITITKIALIIIFIGCLFNMPYGYFQFVRFFGMIGFVLLATEEKKNDSNIFWFVIWVVSALLINPFFKIALGRTIWNIVDVVWVIVIFMSMTGNKKTNKNSRFSQLLILL